MRTLQYSLTLVAIALFLLMVILWGTFQQFVIQNSLP